MAKKLTMRKGESHRINDNSGKEILILKGKDEE
jgi:hypothetical protein